MLITSNSASTPTVAAPVQPGQPFFGVSVGPVFWGRGLGGLTMDGTGLFGTGLFSSGMDYTQWTWAEWAAIALLGVGAFSLMSHGGKGNRVMPGVARARSLPQKRRAAKIQKLRKEAEEIEAGL